MRHVWKENKRVQVLVWELERMETLERPRRRWKILQWILKIDDVVASTEFIWRKTWSISGQLCQGNEVWPP